MASKLNFARQYEFYLGHQAGGLFFQVAVICNHPLNAKTGMTVDLVALDKIAHHVFKNAKRTNKNLVLELEKKVLQLQSSLKKKEITLISTEFKESRDSALIFKNKKFFSRRTDYAEDSSGDLFKIESTFDHKNQLTALKVFDYKNRIQEEFLF